MAVASCQCPYTHARTNSSDAPVPGQCAEMIVPMTGANSKTICTFHLASGGLRTQTQIRASKIPLACEARFLESLTTTAGGLKGCFGSRCCLMGLGSLWCIWLAFRVDALALIEMMNQINPTLG